MATERLGHDFSLRARRVVNRLANVQAFREPTSVEPHHAVPYLEPGVLDGARQPVERAGASKCEQVTARFQHPQGFDPKRNTWHAVSPLLSHELQTIRRIGHDRMDRAFIHRTHNIAAVASVDRKAHAAHRRIEIAAATTNAIPVPISHSTDQCGFISIAQIMDALAHAVEHLLRGGDADVRADEELLQLLPELVVDAAAVEEAGDLAKPAFAGALERLVGALLQLLGDGVDRLLGGFVDGCLPAKEAEQGGTSWRAWLRLA